ncbi:peptidoglycan-binding domain-containing protein [Nocardiopsis composta]|uniref:Peptidoglycan hydrolase-like protein with peptidoglycan-binding domain n=1 Tax=Nocardiopsis composta TaxID=157465 RepID=A0A7W8QKJ2_9ACTN|nr:peptidoglycan-binding protein [Nocardiopsis composta]MBB5431196.1 peptidoglycan hydrolase-like protein with peptidoglycan-binding domain [Nocardiopsis composta]
MGTMIDRAAAVLASGALALAAGMAGAPAALADGPDTPPQVLAEIEALEWPEYSFGDADTDIAVAGYLLRHLGHFTGEPRDHFTTYTEEAVEEFQTDADLKVTGTLNQETWTALRGEVFGEWGQGLPGDSGDPVRAIQYSLASDYGKDVVVDGRYGAMTAAAVKEVQEEFGIDADGIVGKITFRAMVCGGV